MYHRLEQPPIICIYNHCVYVCLFKRAAAYLHIHGLYIENKVATVRLLRLMLFQDKNCMDFVENTLFKSSGKIDCLLRFLTSS
jgi:hypothetical protein